VSEPVVAVLAYHRVGPLPEGSWETWWHLPEDRFVEHLDLLAEQDWTPVDVPTFLRGLDDPSTLPRRTALITFDDAYSTLPGCPRAHLVERGWPGVVFAPTAFIGGRNAWDDGTDEPSEAVCGWDELRELEAAGISVEGHSVTHPRFSTLGEEEIRHELEESKRLLEDALDKRVDLFAYPYGDVGLASGVVERAGYRAAFLFFDGAPFRVDQAPRYRLPRVPIGPDTDLEAELASST
jgi:peptidoglycan/xylan/chitin deacetylase (PgdA/CDA1 family)